MNKDLKQIVKTTTAMSIGLLSNEMLAAANNGISGFGRIGKSNMSHEWFFRFTLINAGGLPKYDYLGELLTCEINKRVKLGVF